MQLNSTTIGSSFGWVLVSVLSTWAILDLEVAAV